MNLVGKNTESDQCLSIESNSNPNSVIKKQYKKPKVENRVRESQSFPTSMERKKSTSSKSKIKVFKTKAEKTTRLINKESKYSPRDSAAGSIRSAKVQMILERHRKNKNGDLKTSRHHETHDEVQTKVKNMSNKERRQK